MADRNALINRLSSVETLGTTGIIFSDKTGTLTENRMTVTHFLLPGDKVHITSQNNHRFEDEEKKPISPQDHYSLRLALETGVLCNNASLTDPVEEKGNGDPLEVALLAAGYKAGINPKELNGQYPEVREEAFDPEVKMMATWNKTNSDTLRVSVKGAPGTLLRKCKFVYLDGETGELTEEQKKEWLQLNDELASEGQRMLALAYKETEDQSGDPYEDLILVGLVALMDPPRKDVRSALLKCKQAGIRVVMVTGDQKNTARYIAESVGLTEGDYVQIVHGSELPSPEELEASLSDTNEVLQANIFARISPRQKLDLIELYQKRGHIVAMTGDGVNDAPALKKADIGIAMGKRGTQVAKEASDMVLTDDAFATIVSAIEQGRIIFGNIRRFIYYLLSCNVSEVLIVGIATLIGSPLPLLPLQILFLNLVTDVFPALALGVGEGEQGIMSQPPRKSDEALLTNRHWLGIGAYGLVITASVLGALYIGLHYMQLDDTSAVTLSFLTLAFAQLWHVFNMRSPGSGLFNNIVTRNPWVWGALILCILIIISALNIPTVAQAMQIKTPGVQGWAVVLGMSLIPFLLGQLYKELAGDNNDHVAL
jgi:Ca2+-transporting ATPase